MAFTSSVGTVSSSPGGTSPGVYGPTTYMNGPVWNAQPFLQVTVDGIDLTNVLSATMSMGMDITVATATVTLTDNPGISQNAEVVITAGTGPHNEERFRGLVKRTRGNLWPSTYTLICRGMLSRAEEYQQSVGIAQPSFINERLPITGLALTDIVPPPTIATDQNYIVGVLNRVPGLVFDPADIGGTGHEFGTLAWRELAWQPYVTALAQCQKLDQVCLGYRLFEARGGRIVRSQVYGYPTQDADFQLTEGIDVLTAIGDRSIENLINAAYVEGYALGGKPGIISAYVAASNSFQPSENPVVDPFSSSLIEDSAFAQQVAEWRLTERNRETVDVTLTTFRDDPIDPGHTIAVNLSHANLTEPVWVQHVDVTVSSRPVSFRQTVRGLGGGLP